MNIDFLFNGASKRQYENRISFLEQQIERLQLNGIAQANDLGKEMSALTLSLEKANEESQRLATALKAAEEENELLLLQLHQVQEELEAVFLRDQDNSKALEQSEAEQQRLAAECNALRPQLDEAQQALQSLRAGHEQLAARQSETEQQLNHALNAKTQLEQSRSSIQQQLTDAEQENELLLLQLHQVQEELEHYFLEHQKQVQENELMNERWRRLEKRLPHYLDFEGLAITAVDTVSKTPKLSWRATGVTINGTVVPEILFDTFLVSGHPGIRFDAAGDQVAFVPAAVNRGDQDALASFRKMTPIQWRTLNAIANLIEGYLRDTKSFNGVPQGFDPVFWRQAVIPLTGDIRRLPPVFRFNRIELKRELIHRDYEHIWMVLTDASYGRYQWPKFEMRIGAANLMPEGFTVNPKLEFPLIDGKDMPFDSWYEESRDHIGGKFEIRFDLARKVFDANVWTKLSVEDQALMLSFIGVLPHMLEQLQTQRVVIARDWREWLNLALGMVDTLRLRLARPKAAAPKLADDKASLNTTTLPAKSANGALDPIKAAAQSPAPEIKPASQEIATVSSKKAPALKKGTSNTAKPVAKKSPAKVSTAAAGARSSQSGSTPEGNIPQTETPAQTKLFEAKPAETKRGAGNSAKKVTTTKPAAGSSAKVAERSVSNKPLAEAATVVKRTPQSRPKKSA